MSRTVKALAAPGRSGSAEALPLSVAGALDQSRSPALADAIEAGRVALFGDHKPTDTLLGVDTLAHPGCLIEIDAIAVLEDP